MTSSFLFAGAELDSASSILLMKYHKEGWRFYGHHMTIHYGLSTLPKSTEEWLLANEGKEYSLTVIAVGKSDKAIAVEVAADGDIPCSNNLRHITVSVAPNGRPVDSNNITEWRYIKPFRIKSKITIYERK